MIFGRMRKEDAVLFALFLVTGCGAAAAPDAKDHCDRIIDKIRTCSETSDAWRVLHVPHIIACVDLPTTSKLCDAATKSYAECVEAVPCSDDPQQRNQCDTQQFFWEKFCPRDPAPRESNE